MLEVLNVAVSEVDVRCYMTSLALGTELITVVKAMKVMFKVAVHLS